MARKAREERLGLSLKTALSVGVRLALAAAVLRLQTGQARTEDLAAVAALLALWDVTRLRLQTRGWGK